MAYRPLVDELLKLVGTAVAVVASLGAVAVVLDQFTLRARLRRTEAWAVAMLGHDTAGPRRDALADVRLDSTARVVAGIMMPLRFFWEAAIWTAAAPFLVLGACRDAGESFGGVAAVMLVSFTGLWLSSRRAIRLYLERCRIASEYRRGVAVSGPRSCTA